MRTEDEWTNRHLAAATQNCVQSHEDATRPLNHCGHHQKRLRCLDVCFACFHQTHLAAHRATRGTTTWRVSIAFHLYAAELLGQVCPPVQPQALSCQRNYITVFCSLAKPTPPPQKKPPDVCQVPSPYVRSYKTEESCFKLNSIIGYHWKLFEY